MSIQGCFPLGLTDLISLHPKGPSSIFSKTTVWKYQSFGAQPSLWSNSHIYFCISLHIYPKHQEELLYQPSFQSSISFLRKKVIVIILLFLLEDSEQHLLVYNLNCPVKDRTFLPKDSMLPYLVESSYLLHCSWDSFSCPGLRQQMGWDLDEQIKVGEGNLRYETVCIPIKRQCSLTFLGDNKNQSFWKTLYWIVAGNGQQ